MQLLQFFLIIDPLIFSMREAALTMETYRPSSHSPFRSRRSHPALNHISLAPLTPRFPIDDLDQDDYFQSHHGQSTSYLSSSSVPSTPPILSHSRASSRTRHHRRTRSSNYALSDTDLRSLGTEIHQQQGQPRTSKSGSQTPSAPKRKSQDSEWLLRAGLALTSSTREEKGQSWLVKRESSTSLVAEAEPDVIRTTRHHRRGRSTPFFRSARSSAVSTPAALSRRPSRSRDQSRYASRADFAMTAMGVESGGASRHSRKSSMGSYHATLPDFVDERIRAEIASIHRHSLDEYDDDFDDHLSGSSSYDSETGTDDEMDEKEFQRLTRERGFGLGSWVDQLVSWTLFGVEEDAPASPPDVSEEVYSRHATVAFEPVAALHEEGNNEDDSESVTPHEEATGSVERAGEKGGWADASWFLRLARKTII